MRIRQIKPEFPFDEELAECSRDARFLFVLMWMLADRAGRLEDRPAHIKAKTFPYDCDLTPQKVSELIDELASGGFIYRYAVDVKRYIWIRNFEKHQHCHIKEAPSEIPEPLEVPQKHGASTVQAPTKPVASTSGVLSIEDGEMESGRNATRSLRPRKGARPSRKTGCPDALELSDSLKSWTVSRAPNLCLTEEIEKFLDWHRAHGSSFSDWHAAWRTWVRKLLTFTSSGNGSKPKQQEIPQDTSWLLETGTIHGKRSG